MLLITVISLLGVFILGIMENTYSIFLKNNNIDNIIHLVILLFVFFPLVWISFIKKKRVKLILYILNVGYIIWVFSNSLLLLIFVFGDVIDMKGNGYRRAWEVEVERDKYFCIYRTHDSGALGGDYIEYYLVDEIFPGFEKRKEVASSELVEKKGNMYFRFKKKLYPFPDDNYIYGNDLGSL